MRTCRTNATTSIPDEVNLETTRCPTLPAAPITNTFPVEKVNIFEIRKTYTTNTGFQ